jgi:hypothetical protein
MTVKGIDVSSYQSTDYGTSGLAFVLVKATEGTSYVNPRHAAQVSHGRSAHLVVGHYHFARPGSVGAQASYFLKHAAPKAGDILALDWEDTGVSGADKDALVKRLPPERLRDSHHWLILHGRYVCKARQPECWRCVAARWCRYPDKTPAPASAKPFQAT